MTKEEKNAIARLKRLERVWPKTLWLFAEGSALHVMRKNDEGEHRMTSSGGVDPEAIVTTIYIESDGGGW